MAICASVIGFSCVLVDFQGEQRTEGMRFSVFLFFFLSLSFTFFIPLSPSHNRTAREKKTTQHQNSRPELRLSHKKTKHPFNLSSYYIAIFSLFDLRTMPRICLRRDCFQTFSRSAIPSFCRTGFLPIHSFIKQKKKNC